jgi:uncharacterized delta-60 repeat protein
MTLPGFRFLYFLLVVWAVLNGGPQSALSQSALDGFDPNANGAIRVIVVQADGKALIGGEFTTLAPNGGATVTRNHIARLNPDGTVDMAFDPNANGAVYAIAVQSDGKIVVGGNFFGANSIGGQTRNFIARLDATTGAADSFDPNASLPVFAIAVQSDGKIVAGGLFNGVNSIGGQTRNYIARLDATTGAADSFDPNANSYVSALLIQPNGKIVAGGDFSGANSIGGQTRNRIARLDPATGLADSFDPNANSTVLSIAQEADGKIIAGGDFFGPNSIGGQTRNFIARLDPITGAADSFDPNASSLVFAVAVQPDGKILAGGSFMTIGGQARNHMARLNPITGLADLYDPSMGSTVFAIAVQQDNKVLVGGDFVAAAPMGGASVIRHNIARLEIDGGLDRTFIVGSWYPYPFYSSAIAFQPDGKILIGGQGYRPGASGTIVRVNTDGTLDPTFITPFNGSGPERLNVPRVKWGGAIYAIAVQADGSILIAANSGFGGQFARLNPNGAWDSAFQSHLQGGFFSIAVQKDAKILVGGAFNLNGQSSGLVRLDPVTGAPDSFSPNVGTVVYSVAVQRDGKILVSGDFTHVGDQTRNHIARIDPVSALADSFDPNANNTVEALALQGDGKILAGGSFTMLNGQPHNDIVRLDPVTGLADSFDSNANNSVLTLALQSDGKILAGGNFTAIGAQRRNRVARLDPATGLADSFDAQMDGNGYVLGLGVESDGKILAGGDFYTVSGQSRAYNARLSNDTAALQNLAVTQSAITWTRGGSSPLLSRVTFEYSTDNVAYQLLGEGTPAGTAWTISGLSLPVGQNIYVRARGFYPTGQYNGSQSITETVRNAFLFGPTRVVSRKIHGSTGAFDIALPITGSPGVECRSGGTTGDYQIIFDFLSEVTFSQAVISGGAGSISGVSGQGTGTITVNLTGVTNAQTINVGLLNASNGTDTSDFVVPVSFLLGDTSGNGVVNASDVTKTKGQVGVPLNDHNFREDVTVNGFINASDVSLVKSKSGTALP